MELPDFDSPAKLRDMLEGNGWAMQKKFGQNFLVSPGVRGKIIDLVDLREGIDAWEIGPGVGSMTSLALDRGAHLIAFEIDRGFVTMLNGFFAGFPPERFEIVQGDVLKTWRSESERRGVPDRIFGNLPYNIAATLIADFVESGILPERMVFTLQKEVAVRMAAKPGTADYSSFSALCASAYTVKYEFEIKRGSFWPIPRVDSAAVSMVRRETPLASRDRGLFLALIRGLFASRRKTIRNNLRSLSALNTLAAPELDAAMGAAGVDPAARGETLSVEEMASLADALSDVMKRGER
jgi:16S rRNA (adenine1518-N6/adenine1519-N6)-dimethyltransferase